MSSPFVSVVDEPVLALSSDRCAVSTQQGLDATRHSRSKRATFIARWRPRRSIRSPIVRRVLANPTIHSLSQQISMPGVTGVLLHLVEQQPAQVRVLAVWRGRVHTLIEAPTGQGLGEAPASSFHGYVVEGVQLGRCGTLRVERLVPAFLRPPATGIGGPDRLLASQLPGASQLLDGCQMLQQTTQGQRRGPNTQLQARGTKTVSLPTEGPPLTVQRPEKMLDLRTSQRWLPWRVGVDVTHGQQSRTDRHVRAVLRVSPSRPCPRGQPAITRENASRRRVP
ncbi:hypothetical protein SAMN04488543_1593 [Friedmanniella luteola]|uniref:Uncharacterized protein n=1 Tax=Friedmanniella luteola TaxID=546871 RepID=A0A1H1RLZ1_9ACTN|nr:hypothetical protein SAMN04488543_1593 [Friedmanniella luteola]